MPFPNRNYYKRMRLDDNNDRPLKRFRTEESGDNNNNKILPNNATATWDELNNSNYDSNGKFLSATKTANYLLDDPLLDWLELYYKNLGLNTVPITTKEKNKIQQGYSNNKSKMGVFFNGGLYFEDKVMENLKNKFGNNFCDLSTSDRVKITEENFQKTLTMMKKGMGIIAQAVLLNKKNNTCGIADLLVRSDYINKIINVPVLPYYLESFKAPKLNGNYHYLVIDVKWSTLHFSAKNNLLLKTGRIPAYKGQLAIYNCALGNIQGYHPSQSYILGKGWKREKTIKRLTTTEWGFNCFDQLGIIDFENDDNSYIKKTGRAIKWYQDVLTNGNKWSPLNPPNENMYPNMSNDDMVWGKVKSEIAKKIGEVTLVCNVGIKERKELHDRGVFSFNDKYCSSINMGLGYTETAEKINAVLEINRDKQYNIFPRKIQNNLNNWQISSPVDFYFDFETLNSQFMRYENNIQNSVPAISGLIFEIGVGWVENGKWHFKEFHIDQVIPEEETRIIDDFFDFIKNKSSQLDPQKQYYPRLFHWTNAERNNLYDANDRNCNKWINLISNREDADIKYVDMYKVFTDERIGVKGAYNYKLKSIGRAMYNLKKIETEWPDTEITNGQIAMLEAVKYYQNKESDTLTEKDNQTFDDIIKYNEVDCKIIWEIVEYFRLKHHDLDLDYEPKSKKKLSGKKRSRDE
jgi:acyl-CoA synthetase (AMP-forming)/AMP-acid ligase II